MKKLLIGYDNSPCAEAAIEELSRIGLPLDVEALVLSVADVWLPSNPDGPQESFPPALTEMARKARAEALQSLEEARRFAARGAARVRELHPQWRVTAEAAADSPGWALVLKAGAWPADLVVVGSHGRPLLERIFLGSTSHKVAAEAPCSVHVARPRRHASHERLRVVVAVDGSPESVAAVADAAARTWPGYSEFHVVAVLDSRLESAAAVPGPFAERWAQPSDEAPLQAVHRMMEEAAKQLFDAGLKVETFLLRGDSKRELLAHADSWESDFIFLGARGLHHGGRLALGTTASALAARAHCSVIIVRPA